MEMVRSINEQTRVECGFASIGVVDRRLDDRMDSYFLAETLKYLYLLFDFDNSLNTDNFVFSTEGHYFPLNRFRAGSNQPSKVRRIIYTVIDSRLIRR